MRNFALKDSNDPDNSVLAVLTFYEREREYFFDMPEGTDPWSVPLILSSFAARGEMAVSPYWTKRWVESRVVPPDRQNLGEVLKENGLTQYDEFLLLEMTEGRCSQDDCYLVPLRSDEIPAWFAMREQRRIVEAVPLEGGRLLVVFRDGAVRVCDVRELEQEHPGLGRILEDRSVFNLVGVGTGGRDVHWGMRVSIDDATLRRAGTVMPVSWGDIRLALPALLVDTAEASQLLGCSRQNVAALAKRGSLPAVKSSSKCMLFLRADVRDKLE